jgi:hypothetical protein
MEPTFEKANEIYFRLGIIYKQQQKFNQSLDVSVRCYIPTAIPNDFVVLQVHCYQPASAPHRRGYLVPDWSRVRTTERGMSILDSC